MKILIVGKDFQSAIKYFDELIGELKFKEVETVRRNINDYCAKLTNGDTYKIVRASESSKGCKCDKAYVQVGVSNDFVEKILKPMFIMSDLPEWQQIIYFD